MKKLILLIMVLGAMFASPAVFAGGELELLYESNDDGTLTVTGAVNVVNGQLTIPESHNGSNVTAIATGAFMNRADILDVKLPSTLGEVAMYSFVSCSNLTNVEIQAGVTKIGEGAFYGCSLLRHVTLPSTLVSIEGYAFDLCGELEEIELPDSLVSIGYEAFSQAGLKSVRLPASVETLGENAFFNSSLTNADLSASSVKVIGAGTFCQCRNLESVTLPTGVSDIGYQAFQFTELKSIEIPAACTNIGNAAFTTSKFSDIHFLGDAPKISWLSIPPDTKIHVQPGAKGFDDPAWSGYEFDPPLEPETFEIKIVAFSVTESKLHFTVALTDGDGNPQKCEGQTVTLLGAEDLLQDFDPCDEFVLPDDGSFIAEIPEGKWFFKVSLGKQER